jgi:uncharacterized protein involved in exopolysaccharide biosynthesis
MDSFKQKDAEFHSASDKELIADAAAAFIRYQALFWVVLLATITSAYVTGQLQTERYETTAKVLVKLGRENTEVPATVQKGSVMTAGVRKEELSTEVQMLSSQSLVEAVVDQLGPEAFAFKDPQPETILQKVKYYIKSGVVWGRAQLETVLIWLNLKKELTNREKIISGIEGALSVEAERDSQIIVVKLLYPDPDLAVRVLNTLLQLYLDRHVQVWKEVAVKDFFDVQVANYKQKLQELETAREDAKSTWNLISVAEQRTLLLQQLQKLNNQIHDNETESKMLQARQASMRDQLKALPDELRQSREVRSNPLIQSLKERLTNLEQEYARLSTLYHPDLQRIKNLHQEIADLKRLLEKEDPTLVWLVTMQANPLKQDFAKNIQEVGVQIAGLEASNQQLHVQAAGIQEQLKRLNAGERQLVAIEREYQLAEQDYLSYVKRRAESLMAQELDRRRIVNVTVLSSPDRPIQPTAPRRLFMMGISFPLGALLGAALVLLAEYMNDVVATPRDLAGIGGLTYLGAFHLMEPWSLLEPDSKKNSANTTGLFSR